MGKHCGRDHRLGLEKDFERLNGWDYSVIEEACDDSFDFNCIAWAAGDREKWWWPAAHGYWPPGCPREETLEAFLCAFGTLGYERCESDDLEAGFDRIAIFADGQKKPTHAARQLDALCWSSKLGTAEILCHPLRAIEGELYGCVAILLRRPSPPGENDPVVAAGCPGGRQA
jgi:hypothetical protein